MKEHTKNWTEEDEEHYKYLRSRHIGEAKAKKMAREMTGIDKRSKKRR